MWSNGIKTIGSHVFALLHYALLFWRECRFLLWMTDGDFSVVPLQGLITMGKLFSHFSIEVLFQPLGQTLPPKAISIDNIKSPKLQRYYESKGVKSHPSASLTSHVRRCTYSTCLPPPSSPPSTVAWALLFLSAPVPTLPLVLSVPHAVLPTLWSDTRWWTQSLKGSPSGCYSL